MSLRLLQRSLSGVGDRPDAAGRGRGRPAQRSQRTMSLQQFQNSPGVSKSGEGGDGSPPLTAWSQGAARGPAARPKPQAKADAWSRGPPTSAVDALWAAPAANNIDNTGHSWDDPIDSAPHASDDGNADWSVEARVTPVIEDAETWETEPAGHCVSHDERSATFADAEATVVAGSREVNVCDDVVVWLRELNLIDYQQTVLAWCEEMGAASLEEVVDSVQELAEVLNLKPLQRKRLERKAREVMDLVMSIDFKRDCDGQDCDGQALREIEEATCSGSEHQPQSFYGAKVASSKTQGAKVEQMDEEETEYLKQKPTEHATWIPTTKIGQAVKKRQQRQQSMPGPSSAEVDSAEMAQKHAEATRRLEEQINSEKMRKRDEALASLEAALECEDLDVLEAAIKEGSAAGLHADDLKEADRVLQTTRRRLRQQRQSAVCELQAILEAPRDESFGQTIRSAIEAAAGAEKVEGGAAALHAAKAALREWELEEQQRGEAKMALQFAIRRGESLPLQAALREAGEAGLEGGMLFREASGLLKQLVQREQGDADATGKLTAAIRARDLLALEEAVEECSARGLPLQQSEGLLRNLREESRLRESARSDLLSALESKDPTWIRAAVERGREARVNDDDLRHAEARVEEIEVAVKRRENACVELYLARSARDARRLEVAIAEGRYIGLTSSELVEAEQDLKEIRELECRRRSLCAVLARATRDRQLSPLRHALQAADGIVPLDSQECSMARATLEELEEQSRLAEEKRQKDASHASLLSAIERCDWDAIEMGRKVMLEFGVSEETVIMQEAAAKLDELREVHEIEEAERIVKETDAKLTDLSRREGMLVGAAHKKERSAIGKEVMLLRGSDDYISAKQFLRDPAKERQRRADRAHEIEERALRDRHRREQRYIEVKDELRVALERRDEDAVRACVIEGVLDRLDAEKATAFLSEQEQRREAAGKDAMILELFFHGVDRRNVFKASIAVNEILTDQYKMLEGIDFKLKVAKTASSVFVAFRSTEFAQIVEQTIRVVARGLGTGHHSSMLECSQVHSALNFSADAEDSLPSLRQDVQNLQRKPARTESEHAVQVIAKGVDSTVPRGNTDTVTLTTATSACSRGWHDPRQGVTADPGHGLLGTKDGGRAPASSIREHRPAWTGTDHHGPARTNTDQRGQARTGTDRHGPARTSTEQPRPTWTNADQHLGQRTSEVSRVNSSTGVSHYPRHMAGGSGSSSGSGVSNSNKHYSIPLPTSAAMLLQRDQTIAEAFHVDLKTFAGKFRVTAELCGLEAVVMRPSSSLHQDDAQRARAELKHLVEYHFPERREHDQRKWADLNVHAEHGAGIEMTPSEQGYFIDFVEEFPGQSFVSGDVIIEINGRSLAGLSAEAMEDTFAECFGHGASLCLISAQQSNR